MHRKHSVWAPSSGDRPGRSCGLFRKCGACLLSRHSKEPVTCQNKQGNIVWLGDCSTVQAGDRVPVSCS
jgi:hypothetical protein